MKAKIAVVVLVLVVLCVACLSGCATNDRETVIITLYGNNGEPIQTWEDCTNVSYYSNFVSFKYHNKDIKVSGTVVMEEK